MSQEKAVVKSHPEGERSPAGSMPPEVVTSVDTFAGKIQMKWVPEAAVSSLGLMPFFIEFLKTSGRFDEGVEECPLQYTSPTAPRKRDVLGTLLLAVLAGHWRYAHINALQGDGVNPELLGRTKVASEDSVRRALLGVQEQDGEKWMKRHLKASYEPLLEEPWALDIDATVKPLYGHQQDARLGYNPSKPGRPSHVYHSYFIANLRVVLEVEVQAGNQTASSYAQPELWALLDGLPEPSRPAFLRGGCCRKRSCLGKGACDGGSRATQHRVCVQAEADRECEEADREIVRTRWVGGRGPVLAGPGDGAAAERVE